MVVAGLLAAASSMTPGSSGAIAAVGAAAAVQTFSVESSPRDPRSFRGLLLPNGLRVLLCSDPTAKKAAAAMDVQVGCFSDPRDLPGLAHFCEHMLFLGTERFPVEGDFERFVSAAGGSNNAYTDSEDTNYFFDVTPSALPGALERFAGFFYAPLFDESATAREVSAIDSEHSKNLQSDYWRYGQLIKLRAAQSHPLTNFGTGNAQTLRGGDAAARAALLRFHGEHYAASQMSLAVVGPQSLEQLQKLATGNFGIDKLPRRDDVVPASAAYDSLPLPYAPGSGLGSSVVLMRPVQQQRTLSVSWCVPIDDFNVWAFQKPDIVWRLLLGTRTDGGLVKVLRAQGLISGLDASVDEQTRAFALLSVSFDLTAQGLSQWRDVAAALFGYLRLLRDGGVPQHVYAEAKLINDLGFQYAEPPDPQSFVTSAVGALPFFPPSQWLTGPALLFDGASPYVADLLARTAEPADALLVLTADELPGDTPMTEPIYGTRYGVAPVDAAAWAKRAVPPGLAAPSPNRFLPRSLAIKQPPPPSSASSSASSSSSSAAAAGARPARAGGAAVAARPAPRVVASAEAVRLHHLQDATFNLPRGYAFFELRTPQLMASADAAVRAELYAGMLADGLVDDTAEAGMAGVFAGVSADYKGFTLAASGYDDRLPALVSTVASRIKACELSPLDFERRKASLLDGLANLAKRQPVVLCSYHRGLALDVPRPTTEQLLAAAQRCTLADVRSFQRGLLPQAELEALVCGNLREDEARGMLESLRAAVPAAPLPAALSPRRRIVRVPAGRAVTRQHVASNPDEVNGALEVLFQVGQDDGGLSWRLLGLLSQLIDQPFYSELRTKQQLGYIVQSSVTEMEGVRGLVLAVQSSVLPPPLLEQRVDAFLLDFRRQLASMPDAELKSYRDALADEVEDVDKRLQLRAVRFWSEIAQRRYDYERPWRVAAQLRALTRAQLLAFYDATIAAGGPERRRLTTMVFARAGAPSTLVQDSLAPDGQQGGEVEYYPRAPPGEPVEV